MKSGTRQNEIHKNIFRSSHFLTVINWHEKIDKSHLNWKFCLIQCCWLLSFTFLSLRRWPSVSEFDLNMSKIWKQEIFYNFSWTSELIIYQNWESFKTFVFLNWLWKFNTGIENYINQINKQKIKRYVYLMKIYLHSRQSLGNV